MDGNSFNFKSDSRFLHNKCAVRRIDGGVDRISNLPDEIRVHILSFLSLKDAARTSILSSRWIDLWKHTPDKISQLPNQIIGSILSFLPLREAARSSILSSRWLDLWKHTPNLNFDSGMLNFDLGANLEMHMERKKWDVNKCKYIDLVNSVLDSLRSHEGPSLKQFRTSIYVNKSAHSTVAKWLEGVFTRGVERLELDFRWPDLWDRVVLEELLRGSGLCQHPQTGLILYNPLKRLCLKCFEVSGEAIKILLRNCPLLEALIMSDATVTSDIEICGSTLMLKHLELDIYTHNKSIKVSAPNLTSLMIGDGSGRLLLENVPKLVEANFVFQSLCLGVAQHFASAAFGFSSQLKTLNLTLICPEMSLRNEFPQMPNLNKLVVKYHGVKTRSLLPVTAFVWAAPRLQEFKLVFMDRKAGRTPALTNIVEPSQHQHLKLFELAGFIEGVVHHVELVTNISDNCTALQKIILRSSPYMVGCQKLGQVRNTMIASTIDYAKQQLEGRIPQHIQLQFYSF